MALSLQDEGAARVADENRASLTETEYEPTTPAEGDKPAENNSISITH